ncbi:MAG TPA: DinB family protein [Ignavibacteriales bacterium]|nr:DinB family protein [Ignavibacteriales bacterium]
MFRERITMVSEIFRASSEAVYKAIDGATKEELTWKPAPESRPIAEITAHIVRVDFFYLKKMGYTPPFETPKTDSESELKAAVKKTEDYILNILNELGEDSELLKPRPSEVAPEHESLDHILPHLSQHHLYHLAQIIYLRRAQNRNWNSPVEDWEKTTYIIGSYLHPKATAALKGVI